jgi:predicted nucleic acid-binding protein
MSKVIVLDSTPLGLILQKPGLPEAEGCRLWVVTKTHEGCRFVVPEIIEYEIRRELLRMNRSRSLKALEIFISAKPDQLLPLNSAALKLAAELWARARQAGTPTSAPHALDVDVILCAQVLTAGFDMEEVIVATSNAKHLSQFVPAHDWRAI